MKTTIIQILNRIISWCNRWTNGQIAFIYAVVIVMSVLLGVCLHRIDNLKQSVDYWHHIAITETFTQ